MPISNASRRFVQRETKRATDFEVTMDVLTPSEQIFVNRARRKLIPVHRPSWPDFMILTDEGLMFVEVKGGEDDISKNQKRTFNILTKHGHKVYVWREKEPNKLQLWGKHYPTPKGRAQNAATNPRARAAKNNNTDTAPNREANQPSDEPTQSATHKPKSK